MLFIPTDDGYVRSASHMEYVDERKDFFKDISNKIKASNYIDDSSVVLRLHYAINQSHVFTLSLYYSQQDKLKS